MRIRKGDTVRVISGDDRGKTGRILFVFPDAGKAIVEGINFVKRHTRKNPKNPQGGIIEREAPIQMSKIMPLSGGKPTRVGHRLLASGQKIRVARRTGEDLKGA